MEPKNIGAKIEDSGKQWVKEDKEKDIYWPTKALKKKAHVSDPEIYKKGSKNPKKFWARKAKELLDWFEDWDQIYKADTPYFDWFLGSGTNLAYNCLNRHLEDKRNKAAIIWEPEPVEEEERILTYQKLYREVNKFANALKDLGIEKGDPVTFWMPMIPETAIAALACQRIGAWHSIVYTAFSPQAVKQRMEDAGSKTLITVDGFYRGGKVLGLKEKVDEVLDSMDVENCIVVERAGNDTNMKEGRDYYYEELVKDQSLYCESEPVGAEDISFLLYTSGTTGPPKGIKHSCGGYGVQAAATTRWVFDLHPNDVFFSTADIGWITGHTYGLYGPLLNGSTVVWYEGAPDQPEPDRWWRIIEKYGATHFYTAPTAIRMLRKKGEKWIEKHDLSSLRILGSVGEPIDPDTWNFFFEKVGGGRCPILDTYWQTETGGILVSSLPGIGPFVPGVAGPAIPTVNYDVLDEEGNQLKGEEKGNIVIRPPFPPGMLRGIYKNPDKYKKEYWSKYGVETYFSGDGGDIGTTMKIGGKSLIEVLGRVDDVLEVAGHRLGTAEIEEAVNSLKEVVESAVVGEPHEVKHEVPAVFAILKGGAKPSEELKEKAINIVREKVGPVATPSSIYFVKDLPSTESGKIIRRFLRGLVKDEELGDMTTASNPECLKSLAEKVNYQGPEKIPGY